MVLNFRTDLLPVTQLMSTDLLKPQLSFKKVSLASLIWHKGEFRIGMCPDKVIYKVSNLEQRC